VFDSPSVRENEENLKIPGLNPMQKRKINVLRRLERVALYSVLVYSIRLSRHLLSSQFIFVEKDANEHHGSEKGQSVPGDDI